MAKVDITEAYNYVNLLLILTDLLDRRVLAEEEEEAYMPE